MAQEVLHRVGKWLVKVLGKGGARVVGQYTDEHNGIVLDMRAGVVFFGEEGADLSGGGGCSSWACDGGLDNGRQVEHFFARVSSTRLAEESHAPGSICFWRIGVRVYMDGVLGRRRWAFAHQVAQVEALLELHGVDIQQRLMWGVEAMTG